MDEGRHGEVVVVGGKDIDRCRRGGNALQDGTSTDRKRIIVTIRHY